MAWNIANGEGGELFCPLSAHAGRNAYTRLEKSTKDFIAVGKLAEEYHVTRMTMCVRLKELGLYNE